MTLSNFYFIAYLIVYFFFSPDLSCVSCMPYLLELNASQNRLTTFFNFKPPKNLKVDFTDTPIPYVNWFAKYINKTMSPKQDIQRIQGRVNSVRIWNEIRGRGFMHHLFWKREMVCQ